jgi:DNA-binding NarL/FixJ family response regulator
MINLIIADDHPIFIDGLKTTLEGVTGITITGEAANGTQVLELLETQAANIVLLDINMPELDGIETAKIIKEKYPHIKVIMLTQYDEKGFINKCKALGVEGYLLKDCDKQILVNAIHLVYKGGTLYGTKNSNNNGFEIPGKNNQMITEKETQVLKLLAEEYCNADIARELKIEVNTVKTYKERLKQKAGVRTAIGLVKWAIENNLI